MRQAFVSIYYQLWLANWLEARFDCKIEMIVSITSQMHRFRRYLLLQTFLCCFIRAGTFYDLQRLFEFLCELI